MNLRRYNPLRTVRRANVPRRDAKKTPGGSRTKLNPIGEMTTARAKRILDMQGVDDTSLRKAAMHIMKVTCQKGVTRYDKMKAMAILRKLREKAINAK